MSDQARLPSVDRVARALADVELPHAVLVRVARRVIGNYRAAGEMAGVEEVTTKARTVAETLARGALKRVINATGVVIHTNLGRSPLGAEAVAAVTRAVGQYTTLEYDLETGERGSRGQLVEELLATLCDSEAATVVNNCAAGLLLVLHHLVKGEKKEVVISRGELVQIGGGFRVPEILEASGAVLREVGTTNQTTVDDYARAIGEKTALVLHVHRSNFWMDGFVGSPTLGEIAGVCREKGVVLVEDLGSGSMGKAFTGAEGEPGPAEVLKAGAAVICFSGDKLFGGPQAGVVAGRAELVEGMKKEPLFRALRCDKMMMAGMEATAMAHLRGDAGAGGVPIVSMLSERVEVLRERAERVVASIGSATVMVVESEAQVGGGSLPQVRLASIALEVSGQNPQALARRLRLGEPAVAGYVAAGKFRLDLRAVFAEQDVMLAEALRKALAST